MKDFTTFVSAVVLATAVPTFCIPHAHVLHEKCRASSDGGWAKHRTANSNIRVPVKIGLKQSNLDRGMVLIMEMYVWPFILLYFPYEWPRTKGQSHI